MIDLEREILWEEAHDDSVALFSDYNKVQYNVIFQFMQKDSFYLFHATTEEKYNKIINSKTIRTSGGCLAGGVYCTPVVVENNGELRLHNLGSYYYLVELPEAEFARTERRKKSKGVIFEIENPNRSAKLLGINYMKFGQIFFRHFMNNDEIKELEFYKEIREKASLIVKDSEDFILYSMSLYEADISYKQACNYMELFGNTSKSLTLLGYVLFEAVSQYLAYYETEEVSQQYNRKNEIYNWNYKELFFALFPFLRVKFDLKKIYYDERKYCEYIEKKFIIDSFDREEFTTTICKKCIQILVQECIGFLDESVLRFDEDSEFSIELRPLLGHIVHRILKEEKYREIYSKIEMSIASDVWEYWNEHDILMVYNCGMAKGEMGINPSLISKFKYHVYECNGIENQEGFYYLQKGNELDVKIQEEIIEYKESTLR